jgi:tetratricopeptide (TPR) repeat protein
MRGLTTGVCVCLALLFVPRANAANEVVYGPPSAWIADVPVPKDDGSLPDAPAKILLRSYQLEFGPRSSEMFVESYIALQTPQGLGLLNQVALPWKPDTDVLTVHKLRLLRGGKIIDLLADGKKFEIMRRENNLEYAALDGILTAAMQPAGAEVGDVFNIAFSVRRESGLIEAPEMFLAEFTQGPQLRLEFRATWDASVPVRWQASEDVVGLKETRGARKVELTWTALNLEMPTQPENVPSRFWRVPRIEFTTYAQWNDVSRTVAPLYASAARLTADSPLKEEARAIAKAHADPVARVEAALKLVQERVRYVYLGMGEGNVKPAAADETWQRRFGDCKGKTTLLIALLRELGIDADPVLVISAGGDQIPDRLPALGTFNHVIVRARAGKETLWLDGTGSGTWRRADLAMPNYQWGLPLSAKGDPLLKMVASPATEPMVVTDTFIDAKAGIHPDAPFRAQVRFRGAMGLAIHGQLSQLTPAAREQALRGYWKKQYDFVEVKSATMELDEKQGVTVLRMEGMAELDWGGNSYTTDGLSVGANVDFGREPGINVDAPFIVPHPVYAITRQTIELPAAGTFTSSGADHDVTLAGVRYTRKSKIVNRVFTGEVTMRSQAPEVTASEARAAEQQLKAMWKDWVDVKVSGYTLTDADLAGVRSRKYTRRADLVWRGNLLLDRREYDEALADFEAAVKADPKSGDALSHRGLAKWWKKDYDGARADFDAALKISPRDYVALRGLGALLGEKRDFKGAIEKLTESLKLDPDDTFALSHRAYAYSRLDETDKALADTAAVLKRDPDDAWTHDIRIWLLTTKGEKAQALTAIDAMLGASPDSTEAQLAAARHYSRLGETPRAVAAMDRAIAKAPTPENYLQRAVVRDLDDVPGKLADANAALAKRADFEPALMLRAEMASERRDHAAAIAYHSERLKREAPSPVMSFHYTVRGIEHHRAGQRAEALRDFAAALADDPDADSYNNHCWHLAIARIELDAALAACDKALAVAPGDPAYLDSRGVALLQLGRFDEAVASFDAALAKKPKAANSLYGRGVGKNRRCQCAEGKADLDAAVVLEPFVGRRYAKWGLAP